jgi:hypothetical protein
LGWVRVGVGVGVGVGVVLDDLRSERLREAAVRHSDRTLEVLDDARGEGEGVSLLAYRGLVEVVGDHELRQVAHHLGRGRHLDDVAEQPVGSGVGGLDLERSEEFGVRSQE